jgi:hypothetical protein
MRSSNQRSATILHGYGAPEMPRKSYFEEPFELGPIEHIPVRAHAGGRELSARDGRANAGRAPIAQDTRRALDGDEVIQHRPALARDVVLEFESV